MSNIYYLIPDLFKPKVDIVTFLRYVKRGDFKGYINNSLLPKHKPVGGIKVMYQHCLILNELGFNAQPVLMGKYKGNFFGYNLDFISCKRLREILKEDDVLVSTEFHPYDGLAFDKGTKVMFMQNWLNLDRRFLPKDAGKTYADIGYNEVITCGQFCSDMVKKKMQMNATTITNGIDQVKFKAKKELRIEYRILALSRKNLADLHEIMDKLGELACHVHIVDGLTQDELILEYQKSDIFLATGYPEGLPLPPLEAMNCGCVVVGFTGGGAKEYMIDGETALVAKDGDCDTAVKHIKRVLEDVELKEKLRRNGMRLGKTYTLDNTKSAISDFFSPLINNL